MHWSEEQFWNSTFYTVSCAYIGHCQANGLGRWAENSNGLSAVQIETLRADTAALKEKYPDVPAKESKRLKRLRAEEAGAS